MATMIIIRYMYGIIKIKTSTNNLNHKSTITNKETIITNDNNNNNKRPQQ